MEVWFYSWFFNNSHQHSQSKKYSSSTSTFFMFWNAGLGVVSVTWVYEIGGVLICFLHCGFHYGVVIQKFESFWSTWHWIYRPTVSRKWYFIINVWFFKFFPLPLTCLSILSVCTHESHIESSASLKTSSLFLLLKIFHTVTLSLSPSSVSNSLPGP
jgi:hypothetical protein